MKTVLIVDTNYMLISRAFIHKDILNKEDSIENKEYGCKRLFQTILQQVQGYVNKYPSLITDVIFVTDKGSWRKKITLPESLKDITYKGQRNKTQPQYGFNPDWDYIFKFYSERFIDFLEGKNLAIYSNWDVEGDDWANIYSQRVFEKGNNVILWTTDCDWQQLIQTSGDSNNAVVWYNGKKVVTSDNFESSFNPMSNSLTPNLEQLLFGSSKVDLNIFKSGSSKSTTPIQSIYEYVHSFDVHESIDPHSIVLTKVITGDSSDNIKSIWHQTSPTTVNITENMINKFSYTPTFERDILSINSGEYPMDLLEEISKIKKFSIKPSIDQLKERYDYNKKLVWLHPSQYPEHVLNNIKYKHGIEKSGNINSSIDYFNSIVKEYYSYNLNKSHEEEIIPF